MKIEELKEELDKAVEPLAPRVSRLSGVKLADLANDRLQLLGVSEVSANDAGALVANVDKGRETGAPHPLVLQIGTGPTLSFKVSEYYTGMDVADIPLRYQELCAKLKLVRLRTYKSHLMDEVASNSSNIIYAEQDLQNIRGKLYHNQEVTVDGDTNSGS